MENITSLLKKNPELRDKYVAVGTVVADTLAKGLSQFMRHLLVVQDINPNTEPGQRERDQFSQNLIDLFDRGLEPNEYTGQHNDEAFLQKHFDKAKGKFAHLNKAAYKKLTDLSLVDDREEEKPSDPLQVTLSNGTIQEVMKSDSPTYTSADQDKFAKIAEQVSKAPTSPSSYDGLKVALETLAKYAASLEETPKEFVVSGRTRPSVGPARRLPGYVKVVKTFKNGLFRRVNDKKE